MSEEDELRTQAEQEEHSESAAIEQARDDAMNGGAEEAVAREEQGRRKRTPAFDEGEINSENENVSRIHEITHEEKQAMMSRPVEYTESYVAPSGDVPYNPGSYSRLTTSYFADSPEGNTTRDTVQKDALAFQQTPVYTTLSNVSAYKTQLQSDAWDSSKKDELGMGSFDGWDSGGFFSGMADAKVKKNESGLYGMSAGIRYAIPGAVAKKNVKQNHPQAINLLGGFGSYEKTTSDGKIQHVKRSFGLGLPQNFYPVGTPPQTENKTRHRDTAKSTPRDAKNTSGMYRPGGGENTSPIEYNPGNYSILGGNYFTNKTQRIKAQNDAKQFEKSSAYTDLMGQHADRLAGQSAAFLLGGKVVDTASRDEVYARESKPGGNRLSKVTNKEPGRYTKLGENYLNPDPKYDASRTKVRKEALKYQESKPFKGTDTLEDGHGVGGALWKTNRLLKQQSAEWVPLKPRRPAIDPTAEGYAESADNKRHSPKVDAPSYGGIPYIIPAALYERGNKIPTKPDKSGEGTKATGYQGKVGSMGGATEPDKKKGGDGGTKVNTKEAARITRWEKMTPYQQALFKDKMPVGGVSAKQLAEAESAQRQRYELFKKKEIDLFMTEISLDLKKNKGSSPYAKNTILGEKFMDEKRVSDATAAMRREDAFNKLSETERFMYYGNRVPAKFTQKTHDEKVRQHILKHEKVSSFFKQKDEMEEVARKTRESENLSQTKRLDPIVLAGRASYVTKQDRSEYTKRNIDAIQAKDIARAKSETSRLDKLVLGDKASYVSKNDYTGYVGRNVEAIVEKENKESAHKTISRDKLVLADKASYIHKDDYIGYLGRNITKIGEKEKAATELHAKNRDAWNKSRNPEQKLWDAAGGVTYESSLAREADRQERAANKASSRKKYISDDWKADHPKLTKVGGRAKAVGVAFGGIAKAEALKPINDLLAGRAARGNPQTNRGFLYGGGLQPVNITKTNPEGEFPKKSGRPAKPRRKDPVGGRELAFFGKPFGAPKAPRRTRRGRIIKMTAAERKRASRKPKSFLDSVFGSKW